MLQHGRLRKILKRSYVYYGLLTVLLPICYVQVREYFITMTPRDVVVGVTGIPMVTANMVLLFAAYGASCPIIAKRLRWPRWVGFTLLIPAAIALIYYFTLFGMKTRLP